MPKKQRGTECSFYDRFRHVSMGLLTRAMHRLFRKIHLIICSALWKMWTKTRLESKQIYSPNGRFGSRTGCYQRRYSGWKLWQSLSGERQSGRPICQRLLGTPGEETIPIDIEPDWVHLGLTSEAATSIVIC